MKTTLKKIGLAILLAGTVLAGTAPATGCKDAMGTGCKVGTCCHQEPNGGPRVCTECCVPG